MSSYEQTLHLFGRWCADELKIYTVDKITENVVRKYIDDLQTRGKYTFYVNDLSKKKNYPDRRRDYRKPVSVTTINNYIRNIRVFFNWLEREYIIRKNPMKRIRQLKYNRQAKVFLSDEDLKKLLSKFDNGKKEQKEKKEEQERRDDKLNQELQELKDGKWVFPAEKFYRLCQESHISSLDNEFSINKAAMIAKEIIIKTFGEKALEAGVEIDLDKYGDYLSKESIVIKTI